MAKIILTVQPFIGIEEIEFEPAFTNRVKFNEWEIDPLNLWQFTYNELGAINFEETFENPQLGRILVNRLTGAAKKALKENGGWSSPSRKDLYSVVQQSGKNLADSGLIATRYVSKPTQKSFSHVSVDLKFNDGAEIICPSEVETMWDSVPFIVKHLNDIGFQGGGWLDKSDWGCFDHIFSHGH